MSEDLSKDLFNEGKKLYVVGDYGKALEFLSKACKSREECLGHLHGDMFEPYFYLAKGYYMFSKYETELIGDGLELAKENKDENGETDLKEVEILEDSVKVSDTLKEVSESDEGKTDEPINDEKVETCEETEAGTSENDLVAPELNEEDSEEKEEDELKECKENLTYLQLAYETIECAKLVLKRQLEEKMGSESDLELKLADCCDLVGNIYMEEGVMAEAIEEYQSALVLRQKHLGSNDRAIAESYYNLGVAFCADSRPGKAVEAYQQCRQIMVACQTLEGGGSVAELTEIIADLDERIVDCKEGERDYELAKESIKQFMTMAASTLPANDLTHLLRRKTSAPRDDVEEPPSTRQKLN